MRRSRFFLSERGGGGGGGGGAGGGSKPNGEKTALIFLMFVLGFFSQIFRGCGGSNYLRGGGIQMPISIEFDRTCDLPGMGSGPPPSGSAHA